MEEEGSAKKVASEAVKTAVHTAKAVTKAAAGEYAGAAVDTAKALPGLIKAAIGIVLANVVLLFLLIAVILGVITCIGSTVANIFTGGTMDLWSIEQNFYNDYEPQMKSMYRKAYYKEIYDSHSSFEQTKNSIVNWANMIGDALGGDIPGYQSGLSIGSPICEYNMTFSGMFGDEYAAPLNTEDDDTYLIDNALINMMCMYNLWNATIPENDTYGDEYYAQQMENFTESVSTVEELKSWSGESGDGNRFSPLKTIVDLAGSAINGLLNFGSNEASRIFDTDYYDSAGYPTMRGLRKLLRQNADILFFHMEPDGSRINALSEGTYNASQVNPSHQADWYTVSVTKHWEQYEVPHTSTTIMPDGEIVTTTTTETKQRIIYKVSTQVNIIYQGETEFIKDANCALVLSPEDYENALGEAEAYAMVLGINRYNGGLAGEIEVNLPDGMSQAEKDGRTAVVNEALWIVSQNVPYSQTERFSLRGMDCSSFVKCAYDWSGYNMVESTTESYRSPRSTYYVGELGHCTVYPGDILIAFRGEPGHASSGHAVLYIGEYPEGSGNICVANARTYGKVAAVQPLSYHDDCTHVYRYNWP